MESWYIHVVEPRLKFVNDKAKNENSSIHVEVSCKMDIYLEYGNDHSVKWPGCEAA